MNTPFNYCKLVTGKNFFGRSADVNTMNNLLLRGENVFISEPPKTGKASLIQQALLSLKSGGKKFSAVSINLLGIRSAKDLAIHLGGAIFRGCLNTPAEYAAEASQLLAGTHLIFDSKAYEADGSLLSLNWDIDDNDLRAVFELPFKMAQTSGIMVLVIIEEFQNIMLTEDGDHLCKLLEAVIKSHAAGNNAGPEGVATASFIFSGSQINAMHEIFGVQKYFFRQVERVPLGTIDTKEIIDHVVRGFLATGKVVDRDLLLGVCKLFRNNIWYINHFSSICDSLTKGYIMEPTLNEALEVMLAIHNPRFIAIMNDLTTFQVNLLRAILDGCTRFSSSDVIRKYGLNSSANVRRLKDALCKKEIIFFDDNSNPIIIDPLFEYWVARYYFDIKYE